MDVTQFSKDIQFTLGYCPHDYSITFETYLYNETKFLQPKVSAPPLSFYILHFKKNLVLARIHFSIEKDEAISLPQSPFGGLEVSGDVSVALLDEFVSYIENQLKMKAIRLIRIKQCSFIYSPGSSSKITNAYLRKGFTITHPDLNHHIMVDDTSFFDKVHPMEKRKLKKAQSKSFIFLEESVDNLVRIYEFILMCRIQKKQNLNITFADLMQAVKAMPENYKIFTLKDGDKIIACSVIVVVNERIAYNFLPASSMEYKQYSPMVFLLSKIYDYCIKDHFQVLDLGISSVDNLPQYGLLDFKERLGGEAGLKLTFLNHL